MINNGQSTLLLYCCEDVKSHRSGGDTVPLSIRDSCASIFQPVNRDRDPPVRPSSLACKFDAFRY